MSRRDSEPQENTAPLVRSCGPILVVDDEPLLRQLYSLRLQQEGYAVEVAGSGEEAWARLQHRPLPCLIVLDLTLPGMSGIELRRRQRADVSLATIPVVIVTGDLLVSAAEALVLDAVDYLTKPIDFARLVAIAGRYCTPGTA